MKKNSRGVQCRGNGCGRTTNNAGLVCRHCLDRVVKPIPEELRKAVKMSRAGDPFVRAVRRGDPVLTLAGNV